ncbi:MAG TPA: glycosyltransferase family 4 protein [Chthonomonadaceae bacterium]|nr:glycosyltransferase family 4 protein [Chthonomonadaceae bacterium]
MRVLHVLHTSLPFICGYSIRSDYILRFQQQLGLTPAVVTSAQHPNGESLQEEIQGILYWRTPAYAGLQKPLARELGLMRLLKKRLQAAVREFEPDLIHAHSPMLAGLPALAVARAAGRPFVYEVRDLWENASVDRGKFGVNSPVYRLARRMETRVLRRADAVVTICHCLREELAPRVGRTDRLFVVDNGVDVSGFTPDVGREEQRRRWRLEGKRIIGYVGTFQPYEGLDMLISALPQILKQEPQAHLVITGSGGQENALRQQVCDGGLDAHVTFTGRLPHDQVAGIYALADFMVYPRILTRTTALTTPLKPLEAMAMRKAVMVSDVKAMQELVRPGETGLMFRAGDVADLVAQCAGLLQEPDRQEQLGCRARDWVLQERQWPALVARYQEIYKVCM